jgi:hypothetical protein
LEAKSSGLFMEAADEVVLVFFFVVTLAGVAVFLAVFEHSVNDPGSVGEVLSPDRDEIGEVS